MFLVTKELLVEAHEGPENPWLTATFFAGFLLFLILGMISIGAFRLSCSHYSLDHRPWAYPPNRY